MKFNINKWTLGLAAVGAVSMASAVRADDAPKLSPLQTALSSTIISGYVDVAAQYNPGNQQGGATTPVTTFGQKGVVDGFSLNSVNIALDKALDESPWAAGYHIELNAGQDAINGVSFLPSGSWSGADGGIGVRQAYVALRTPVGNGIDWKIGAFDGVTGYEANTGYANPNYSRSYGYAVNPASEVGLLGTYKISDEVSVMLGIANRASGFTPSPSVGSSKDYIAAVSFTAPDKAGFLKGSTLNFGTVQTFDNGGVNNYSVNATLATPITGFKVGVSYDKVQNLQYEGGDGNIFGVYATLQATDKLSYNLRGEYVDGKNLGFFYVGSGNNGKGEEITATVEYDLWANVVTRAEFRWDHTETGNGYNSGFNESTYLLALNVVYKF